MSMFEHEGQEYEELRAREEACQERMGALESVLREGAELALHNMRAASQRHLLVAWSDKAEAALRGTP